MDAQRCSCLQSKIGCNAGFELQSAAVIHELRHMFVVTPDLSWAWVQKQTTTKSKAFSVVECLTANARCRDQPRAPRAKGSLQREGKQWIASEMLRHVCFHDNKSKDMFRSHGSTSLDILADL
eukprot:6489142-Amphidinium_carterae.1